MMKKLFAIALSLAVALSCAAALAQGEVIGSVNVNGAFELRGPLPAGYETISREESADRFTAVIGNPNDDNAMTMMLTVAFDEMYGDVQRLNDLDDAALAAIEATFSEEDNVEITYTETSHGTMLMVVRERTGESDYVVFYTIYLGYAVEFDIVPNNGEGLTDEQVALAVRFLSDLEFVPVN